MKKQYPLRRREAAELERLRAEIAEIKQKLAHLQSKLDHAEYMQRVTDEMANSITNIRKAAGL